MGALFTVNPPAEQPAVDLPWIVTIGPLDDEAGWEPVLCGPYERPHAVALARAVVADDEFMAVVEPVQPYTSVDQIRSGIAAAQAAAEAAAER
ncbi:MAG: hypothetical protein HKP61_14425, partial [Dactylosporangium sp.]|nr:hypothetical protein [Dactylosporangium sp.]NNJ62107.1 hypothetical protein [Dactylosporangium sp.]